MERWKYLAITHQDHLLCNPLTVAKIDELLTQLHLDSGARVLDIACGKAEVLVRLAEHDAIYGIGVDLSPFCVRDAQQKARDRGVADRLHFVHGDGDAYAWGSERFDLSLCVGTSWVFGGHEGTLAALRERTLPGGLIVVGEPYWRKVPPQAYLDTAGITQEAYAAHEENVHIGESLGLRLLYTVVSNQDDWDRYEGLQWQASERYARRYSEDPDVPELLNRVHRARSNYLAYGRDVLGWALYLFRNDESLP